jgi:hypothetical protein
MATQEQLRQVIGAEAYDRDGDKLGRIGQVYYGDDIDQPKWITVNTGLFGLHESFVPLRDAQLHGDRVVVAYDKATVKDAPHVADDRHLSVEEEQGLYRHYSLDYGAGHNLTGTGDCGGRDLRGHTEGYDTSGPTSDTAMTRSEEHLRVIRIAQHRGHPRVDQKSGPRKSGRKSAAPPKLAPETPVRARTEPQRLASRSSTAQSGGKSSPRTPSTARTASPIPGERTEAHALPDTTPEAKPDASSTPVVPLQRRAIVATEVDVAAQRRRLTAGIGELLRVLAVATVTRATNRW